MKTFTRNYRHIAHLILALAVAGLLAAPALVEAQPKGKGATQLMKVETAQDLQKLNPGDTIVMACPKCKDIYVQVVDKSFKGSTLEQLKNTPIHLCSSCDTKIVTQGTGRQAKDKLVHTCKTCGSEDAFCCVIKKNGGTTQGMQESK